MADVNQHDKAIEELRKQYTDAGFDELSPRDVADELGVGYVPDLIVRRENQVIVFEVKSEDYPLADDRLRQIKATIESKPGWQFRLFLAPRQQRQFQDERKDALPQANTSFAMGRSFSNDFPSIAVVTLWMSLETAMRQLLKVHNEASARVMSGIAMARRLRDLGVLDDDDVRLILGLGEARNLAVHGYEVPASPSPDQLILVERLLRDAGIFEKDLSSQRFVQG